MLKEIQEYEESFNLDKYSKVLSTVKKLAIERSEKEHKTDYKKLELFENLINKDHENRLYKYLNAQSMNAIKIIEAVMYIGRDYLNEIYYKYDLSDDTSEKMNEVSDPNFLVSMWLEDLENLNILEDRETKINQIYEKMPLDRYLNDAFEILGIE